MDDNVYEMPHISQCTVEGGYDDLKKKSYIILSYQGINILEYYDTDSKKEAPQTTMTRTVRRARERLAIALAAKKRREMAKKLARSLLN